MQTIFVAFRSCSPYSMTNSETAEVQKLKTAHVADAGLLGNRESDFKEKKKQNKTCVRLRNHFHPKREK